MPFRETLHLMVDYDVWARPYSVHSGPDAVDAAIALRELLRMDCQLAVAGQMLVIQGRAEDIAYLKELLDQGNFKDLADDLFVLVRHMQYLPRTTPSGKPLLLH